MTESSKSVLSLFRLDGRRALVTGGSRGLGRVIARALAEAGADVVIVGRTPGDCEAAAAEIRTATGRRADAVAADVTRAADVDRLAAEATAGGRHVDVLVNSAGLNVRGLVDGLAEA